MPNYSIPKICPTCGHTMTVFEWGILPYTPIKTFMQCQQPGCKQCATYTVGSIDEHARCYGDAVLASGPDTWRVVAAYGAALTARNIDTATVIGYYEVMTAFPGFNVTGDAFGGHVADFEHAIALYVYNKAVRNGR